MTPTPLQARIDSLVIEATARHRARLGDAAVAYADSLAAGGATGAGRSHLHVAAVSLAAELAKWDRLTDWRAVIRSEVMPAPLGTGSGTYGRPSPAVRDAAAVLIESSAWYAASEASAAAWEQLAAAAVMYAGKVQRRAIVEAAAEAEATGAASST